MTQGKVLFEFVGYQELPVPSAIGEEAYHLVHIRGFLFPAWEASVYLGNQRTSTAGTSGFSGSGEGSSAIPAQAIPGLLTFEEDFAAECTAYGNQVFPDKRRDPS
jgi:hypothetical protein